MAPGWKSVLRGFLGAALLAVAGCGAGAAAGVPDAEVPGILAALSGSSAGTARGAIDRVVAARDARFTAVFVELLRAAEVGVASPGAGRASAGALESLHATGFGADWHAWVKWYAGTELAPPPGFTGWKGELLGRIDPHFAEILAPGAPSRIRVEEVVWGGVGFEGIPALDRPATLAAGEADYLTPEEPVFGIVLNGEARAYPHRILDWHEMVNDEVGGVGFSLAYCTLCGSGIAYRAEASDGKRYDFGSSGFLMRSNKLMVDRQTRTLWNHLTGRPVLGPLADSEVRLERLPLVVTRWADWRARHPGTRVLSLDTGFDRPYRPGAAYGGYFASPETMFPVRERSRLLPAKERVFGLELGGVPKAYPVEALVEARVVNDTLNDVAVVLVAADPQIEVAGSSVRTGPARYRAGAPVRAYRAGSARFRLEDGVLKDASGRTWKLEEDALVGPDGQRAERLAGFLAYWFGWSSFHPGTLVWKAPASPSSSAAPSARSTAPGRPPRP